MGDAIWVKVFYQESPSATDLGHLVSGDKQVPDAVGEVETEWILVQAGNGGGLAQELNSEQQPGKQSKSLVRRYQFFAYTGSYDPENHEATPVTDSQPQPNELGNLIGNQMAALNLPAANGDHTKPVAVIDTALDPHAACRHFRRQPFCRAQEACVAVARADAPRRLEGPRAQALIR